MAEPAEDRVVSAGIKVHAEYFQAPAEVRDNVLLMLDDLPPRNKSWRGWRRILVPRLWMPVAGAFAMGAVIGALAIKVFAPQPLADVTLVALTSDHARALVTGSEIDVVSSDQHTVKPWLSKTIGISPKVVDLADVGYPLKGGRRGYLEASPVPVMVYGFKNHFIDVYALPDTSAPAQLAANFSINGFFCLSWRQDGFAYVIVSDVDAARLEDFQKTLQARWAKPNAQPD